MDKEQEEFQQQIREFLQQLDTCPTEQARIAKVQELIFGIVQATRRKKERATDHEDY